eukprot:1336564-Pyramimonas_sp.AAC.1
MAPGVVPPRALAPPLSQTGYGQTVSSLPQPLFSLLGGRATGSQPGTMTTLCAPPTILIKSHTKTLLGNVRGHVREAHEHIVLGRRGCQHIACCVQGYFVGQETICNTPRG